MSAAARLRLLGASLALGSLVGLLCGAAAAAFLAALEAATEARRLHPWLTFLLPLAGLALGWAYRAYGARVAAGNNLVIDTLHDDGPPLPWRMAPMVLCGTLLTHLCGGSAGREGTAVQMGASLADALGHGLLRTAARRRAWRRVFVAAGVAGGFGAVFGTPVAAALFALEFVVRGELLLGALVPALTAALVGDWACRGLGTRHAQLPTLPALPLTPLLAAKWLLFGAVVALVAAAFVALTEALRRLLAAALPALPWRLMAGGAAVVALWQLVGSDAYLGLGLAEIQRAFVVPPPPQAFALKLLFTAVTLASGFVGGEVTPLFFIGATLGGALAAVLRLPLPHAAGLGLVGVFACAASAPLTLSVMAVELLGREALPHALWVAGVGAALAGPRGIYAAQRLRPPRPSGAAPGNPAP